MGGTLRPKYKVFRIDESAKGDYISPLTGMDSTDPENIDSPFVLMPRKDPAAFVALITYMEFCEDGLALEIKTWLEKIAEAEPVFGTQGKRNYAHVRTQAIYR